MWSGKFTSVLIYTHLQVQGKQKQQQKQLQLGKANPLNLVTKLVFHERPGYDFIWSCAKS